MITQILSDSIDGRDIFNSLYPILLTHFQKVSTALDF